MSLPSKPDGVTGRLCTWIHQTSFSDIPPAILERARYLILDGLACAIVGAHLPWSETAANGIFKMEAPGQCTVIGWENKKLSPLAASILNSTFTQGFELDDYHSTGPIHSNSILIPALFAAAESASSGASLERYTGADFLRAYVVGCEVGPRVGLALHGMDVLTRGWHSGAVQGPSAAAAAVSSLLGLNPAEIENALGIACTQSGGLMSAQYGSMVKRMQHGFGCRSGVFAALMAKEGYTGIHEVYEVPYGGFLSCFGQGTHHEPSYLPEELVRGLGDKWEIEGVRVKLRAAMAGLHATSDCIERLQGQYPALFAQDRLHTIEKVVTRHGKTAFARGGWIQPKDEPLTSVAAQMSLQFAAAAQLLDRQVLMAQYAASKLNRPAIRELMDKVKPEHDTAIDAHSDGHFATYVTVHFNDGTSVQEYAPAPRGMWTPVSNEDIVEKWRRLVGDVLTNERRVAIEQKVLGLERVGDLSELIALLAGDIKCPIDTDETQPAKDTKGLSRL